MSNPKCCSDMIHDLRWMLLKGKMFFIRSLLQILDKTRHNQDNELGICGGTNWGHGGISCLHVNLDSGLCTMCLRSQMQRLLSELQHTHQCNCDADNHICTCGSSDSSLTASSSSTLPSSRHVLVRWASRFPRSASSESYGCPANSANT